MNSIQALSQQVELAEAAYSNLLGINLSTDSTVLQWRLINLQRDGSYVFSPAQAAAFVNKWQVIDHIPDTSTGFSATIFRDTETSVYTLSVRGTQASSAGDILNDINVIAGDGVAVRQLVDLYNFWKRATSAKNQTYEVARVVLYDSLGNLPAGAFPVGVSPYGIVFGDSSQLPDPAQRLATGAIPVSLSEINVTGHSLGGHLAMAFTRLFPGITSNATVVNALGFKIGNSAVDSLFSILGGTPAFNASRILNVYGIASPEFAAMNNGILQQPGGYEGIYIENGSINPITGFPSHSSVQMTDSAAVYDLFIKLSAQIRNSTTTAALATLTPLFEAASAQAGSSLERVMDALANLFGLGFPAFTVSLIGNRDELYKRIVPLQAIAKNLSDNNPGMHVDVLATSSTTAESLALLASGSEALAYRYALKELNPFAIVGDNALYTPHNVNGVLDLYNEVTGTGELSELWIQYRAEMLKWKNLFYESDGNVTLRSAQTETVQFIDKSGFAHADGHDLVVTVTGRQLSAVSNPAKVVFGSVGIDIIEGSNLAIGDYLYGAAGDDVLQGQGGDDYVEGGRGVDTYIWNDGDGFDTILDTDGLGLILVDGASLSDGFRIGDSSYISSDKKFQYVLDGDLLSGGDLYINGSISIRGFRNGLFGITLSNNLDISTIQPTQSALTANSLNFAIGTELNDRFVSGELLPSGFGDLHADNLFMGLGGDDLVTPSDFPVPFESDPGQNLFGGAGNDVLFARESSLIRFGTNLYGEGGGDVIYGGDGGDYLWGDTDIAMLNFQPDGSVEGTDISISFLNITGVEPFFTYFDGIGQYWDGNSGNEIGGEILFSDGLRGVLQWLGVTSSVDAQSMHNDVIYGGGGADNIYGGASDDLIYAGAGNDLLFGGNGPAGGVFWIYNASLSYMPLELAQQIRDLLTEQGDDYLDGGDGSDYIVDSDGGNDRLIGGNNSDVLRDQNPDTPNGSSFDYLDGGSGDDVIFSEHVYATGGVVGTSRLKGGDGDDLLAVMEGEHYLEGGNGNDGYWIKNVVGKQFVTIRNHGNNGVAFDRLFLEGFENRLISRYANDLLIEAAGQDRVVSVVDWFLGPEYKLSEIIFDGSMSVIGLYPDVRTGGVIEAQWSYLGDGLVLESSLVEMFVINQTGTSQSDTLIGANQNNRIDGGDGNDLISGLAGDDEISGGRGYDTLNGGDGSDTYFFNVGDNVDHIEDLSGIDTLVFGLGVTSEMLTLDLGSLLIHIGENGDAVHIEGFDPADVNGSCVIENFRFSDGVELSYSHLVARGFDIRGADGNDALIGTNIHDRFAGGAGNDSLAGGAGGDTYFFNAGDGSDTVIDAQEPGEINRIVMRDYLEADITGFRDGQYVVLQVNGAEDTVRMLWDDATGGGVDLVEFSDGATWSRAFLGQLESVAANSPPVVAAALSAISTAEDASLNFVVPANTFQDSDVGDVLIYTSNLADGSPLPSWLSFDAATRTFSGTPSNDDIGALRIRVTASDTVGETVSDVFTLDVLNTNDAPVATQAIAAQAATEDQTFQFVLPTGAFADVDAGDTLSYAATLGNGAALPEWLSFDEATGTFSGTPGNADTGSLDIRVIATDAAGDSASSVFELTVAGVNDAPALANPLVDQAVTAGVPFHYAIPADTFTDVDAGDSVTLSAQLADGSALPSWLDFDAASGMFTGTFSGIPSASNVGVLDVAVTATDSAGTTGNDRFVLTVNPAAGLTLTGTAAADTLSGGYGNDLMDGLAGIDQMTGGDGDDSYVVDHAADAVVEVPGQGHDVVFSSVTYTLADAVEDLVITGELNRNGSGNALANTLTGNAGANRLDGGAGADVLIGGLGNDTYVVDDAQDQVFEAAAAGTDTVQSSISHILADNLERLLLTGGGEIHGTGNAQANVLTGNVADNVLLGGAGNDRLIGGEGLDTLAGGAGNDTYVIDNIDEIIIELAGEGTDTVQAPFEFTLGDHFENLTLTGDALSGTGNAAVNRLTGNALDNTLIGLEGNDVLNGGAGIDTLIGGAGNDVYVIDNALDVIHELAGEGTDTAQSSVSFTLAAEVENLLLTSAEAIDGGGNTLNNRLTGNAAANTLQGFEGNDILDGRGGIDTLMGGLGNDSYTIDNAADIIVEGDGEGADAAVSSVSYVLADHVEKLTLTGTAAIDGSGNAGANALTGNAADNRLEDMGGDDVLDGKAGADVLAGGAGDDAYIVDQAGDTVIELADEGIDTVQSTLSWSLGEHLENLALTGAALVNAAGNGLDNGLTGNNAANTLEGFGGNDLLDGKGGNDLLIGGSGDDVYVVAQSGDTVVELADEGIDTVRAGITYALGEHLEHLTLTGIAGIRATGNAGANVLTGNRGNNQLDGLAGADQLIGGTGNDTYIVDDAGDAVLELADEGVDLVKSSVSHALSAQVENLTLTGASAIDGSGNALDNVLLGNAAANALTGEAGNDVLNGGGGADMLSGGAGDDAYVVDNAADTVIELSGGGVDTINTTLNWTLGAQIENLNLTGSAGRNATGNALDNTIAGNRGANILNGMAGNDTLAGGLGNDSYRFDADFGHDLIAEDDATAGNLDRIQFGAGIAAADIRLGRLDDDLVLHTADRQHSIQVMDWFAADAHKVERIEFADGAFWDVSAIESGAMQSVDMPGLQRGDSQASVLLGRIGDTILEGGGGDDSLTDEEGSNLFSGGDGNDVATGGDGNDLFAGGSGNDTLITGGGSNVIAFNAGGGIDTVYSDSAAENTLSLGGGLSYSDLSLSRDNNDLVLNAGADDKVILKDWYVGNSSLLNLQIILDATGEYDAESMDPLFNQRVQNFDFLGLVSAFDAAQAADPGIGQWALGDALTQFHLTGSSDAALGGDLAYWYARNGGFTGIGLGAAQQIIGAPGFGAEAQGLREFAGLQEGMVRLG